MWYQQIPNSLSLLRIALAPLLCFFFLRERTILSLGILFLAALTDFLDGFLARQWGCVSTLGSLLDPIADKVFILTALGTMAYKAWVPSWFFWIVLCRDIMLLIAGFVALTYNLQIDLSPSFVSKCNTALLFLLFTLIMMQFSHLWVLLWVIAFTTVFTGIDYAKRALQVYRAP